MAWKYALLAVGLMSTMMNATKKRSSADDNTSSALQKKLNEEEKRLLDQRKCLEDTEQKLEMETKELTALMIQEYAIDNSINDDVSTNLIDYAKQMQLMKNQHRTSLEIEKNALIKDCISKIIELAKESQKKKKSENSDDANDDNDGSSTVLMIKLMKKATIKLNDHRIVVFINTEIIGQENKQTAVDLQRKTQQCEHELNNQLTKCNQSLNSLNQQINKMEYLINKKKELKSKIDELIESKQCLFEKIKQLIKLEHLNAMEKEEKGCLKCPKCKKLLMDPRIKQRIKQWWNEEWDPQQTIELECAKITEVLIGSAITHEHLIEYDISKDDLCSLIMNNQREEENKSNKKKNTQMIRLVNKETAEECQSRVLEKIRTVSKKNSLSKTRGRMTINLDAMSNSIELISNMVVDQVLSFNERNPLMMIDHEDEDGGPSSSSLLCRTEHVDWEVGRIVIFKARLTVLNEYNFQLTHNQKRDLELTKKIIQAHESSRLNKLVNQKQTNEQLNDALKKVFPDMMRYMSEQFESWLLNPQFYQQSLLGDSTNSNNHYHDLLNKVKKHSDNNKNNNKKYLLDLLFETDIEMMPMLLSMIMNHIYDDSDSDSDLMFLSHLFGIAYFQTRHRDFTWLLKYVNNPNHRRLLLTLNASDRPFLYTEKGTKLNHKMFELDDYIIYNIVTNQNIYHDPDYMDNDEEIIRLIQEISLMMNNIDNNDNSHIEQQMKMLFYCDIIMIPKMIYSILKCNIIGDFSKDSLLMLLMLKTLQNRFIKNDMSLVYLMQYVNDHYLRRMMIVVNSELTNPLPIEMTDQERRLEQAGGRGGTSEILESTSNVLDCCKMLLWLMIGLLISIGYHLISSWIRAA